MSALSAALRLLSGSDEEPQGAANDWAGTQGLGLLGALNAKAGTVGLGFAAVLRNLGLFPSGAPDESEAGYPGFDEGF